MSSAARDEHERPMRWRPPPTALRPPSNGTARPRAPRPLDERVTYVPVGDTQYLPNSRTLRIRGTRQNASRDHLPQYVGLSRLGPTPRRGDRARSQVRVSASGLTSTVMPPATNLRNLLQVHRYTSGGRRQHALAALSRCPRQSVSSRRVPPAGLEPAAYRLGDSIGQSAGCVPVHRPALIPPACLLRGPGSVIVA
jgi:hypothetical protein